MNEEDTWYVRSLRQCAEIDAAEVEFFKELRSRQERLGKEFAEVLFDNLWDLYSR